MLPVINVTHNREVFLNSRIRTSTKLVNVNIEISSEGLTPTINSECTVETTSTAFPIKSDSFSVIHVVTEPCLEDSIPYPSSGDSDGEEDPNDSGPCSLIPSRLI